MNHKIILASGSPRRKKLLQQLGVNFQAESSNIKEESSYTTPEDIVQDLALQKAENVAKNHGKAIIIGADTIVYHKDDILGKPENKNHAKKLLLTLSGDTHSVFTGVAFVKKLENERIYRTFSFAVETKVTFDSLESSEIESYIKTGSPMDKAGAYGIQDDWGAVFVKSICGDYYNVVGLPLNRFYKEITNFEPEFFAS